MPFFCELYNWEIKAYNFIRIYLPMKVTQKSLCVFIHYSKYPYIPLSVKIYVDEISKHFDQVILVTNQRSGEVEISYNKLNISTVFVKNEGYDLGMFYKVVQTLDLSAYNQIACINDSNILFNQLLPVFDWSSKLQKDFWGLIDSNQRPQFSTNQNNYHIQSHFIVFNQRAILKLPAFFETLNIQAIFDEKNTKKTRQTVIDKWEIGLSRFLISERLSCASYIDSLSYSLLYLSGKQANVGLKLYPELIRSGYPLIKKKIITKGKWKDIFRSQSYWKNLIRQYGNPDWEIEPLIEELNQYRNDYGNQPIIQMRRKYWKLIQSLKKL